MSNHSLHDFIKGVRSNWGSLTTERIAGHKRDLERMLRAANGEEWLTHLHETQPVAHELHRDVDHGFILLAHCEASGLYRPPHDHGRNWVIYAVQRGAVEMGTFARVTAADGSVQLIKRDSTVVCAGEAKIFLPGDIHDTHCLSGPALLFRFTERDLKQEERLGHKMTRYVSTNRAWTEPSP